MQFEQLFENLRFEDLQWMVPVGAGLLIILGGLLVAIIRGMSSGVVVALLFGGLMSMSPILLDALERGQRAGAGAGTVVARGAAQLAVSNHDVVADLSRVVASLRTAIDGLNAPSGELSADAGEGDSVAQNLRASEERLDAAISSLSRANLLREQLQEDMDALDAELAPARGSL